ncbi:molybdopterin dinucleotide binding domain-containing protein [Paracoccus sp. S-4012]|uniref:molybdopterin dinucleotide binding domain-containing protein n=1 Tax=Paracoccus sp. S-4012 TaxID=2665648 RepID=UPI001E45EBD8|nr:molybdopterin dinucleotide binding domain-containing protein [Paracoccus sp. S-4012]
MIAAGIAQAVRQAVLDLGQRDLAEKFTGYDWQGEGDAFEDGYRKHANGGEHVTYDRLRAMGNNDFQEPATGVEGETIIGTPRLYTDGKFSTEDGKARFMAGEWCGYATPGKQEESEKFAFLINNGRTNINRQNWFMDEGNEFVLDRWPYPIIEMNPTDMAEIGVSQGDLVEVVNDNGATQAIAYPMDTAKPKQSFMIFGSPRGTQGNVISSGTNELVTPVYKQTWADIRKLSSAPTAVRGMSFKRLEAQL